MEEGPREQLQNGHCRGGCVMHWRHHFGHHWCGPIDYSCPYCGSPHYGAPGYACPHCGLPYYGPPGYPCPHCGFPYSPAYRPGWQPRGRGRRYAPGWAPAGPAYVPPAPPRPATDEEIRAMVDDSLRRDPRIPPEAEIQVEVHGGVATLTGSVPDKWIKHAAGEVALGLPGVVDVENKLQIVRPGERGAEGSPEARQ